MEEIETFLEGTDFIRDSIRIGELEGGRRTGIGSVLFASEEAAEKAQEEKDQQNIGARYIMLSQETFGFWEHFMDDQLTAITVNINRMINEDNLGRTVKLRGLPPAATKQTLVEFFATADITVTEEDCFIELRSGRKTGWALVFLPGNEEQQTARNELNRGDMDGNEIAVFVPRLDPPQ